MEPRRSGRTSAVARERPDTSASVRGTKRQFGEGGEIVGVRVVALGRAGIIAVDLPRQAAAGDRLEIVEREEAAQGAAARSDARAGVDAVDALGQADRLVHGFSLRPAADPPARRESRRGAAGCRRRAGGGVRSSGTQSARRSSSAPMAGATSYCATCGQSEPQRQRAGAASDKRAGEGDRVGDRARPSPRCERRRRAWSSRRRAAGRAASGRPGTRAPRTSGNGRRGR